MNGKSKCKILKDIRRQIARDNDIEYVTSECKYQGECSGTCPKCEAEVRYLEEELRKRQRAGKAVAVAGIAATLVIGSTGCATIGLGRNAGAPLADPDYKQEQQIPGGVSSPSDGTDTTKDTYPTTMGMIIAPTETDPTEEELMGDPVDTTPPTVEVMGEMAPPYE